jgi:hypothetical protein
VAPWHGRPIDDLVIKKDKQVIDVASGRDQLIDAVRPLGETR